MSKSVSGESLLESLGFSKGETLDLCLLAEEEHLEQPGQGLQENFEIFYVVLIGPFVKFYHLIYIHVISVLSVVKYWEGQNLLEMAELQL